MSLSTPVSPASPSTPVHPFANTKSLITVIRDDHVDVEAEQEFLADFEDDDTVDTQSIRPSKSTADARSVISHEIWLDDQSLSSSTFARNAIISGWTCVGDQKLGAYVGMYSTPPSLPVTDSGAVYDCVITTKEGNAIHMLKRYNDFVRLRHLLMRSLKPNLHVYVPRLPPKSPLARYRPVFLDRRRVALQSWLRNVVLHPEIGGCLVLRQWVME
ncbi:hypothetical protein M408DRAFT_158581 [Serendipita vermifera MAFF 305830]|uniref:Endosomal/vacuolar adapter protein YPT35 n=1 Tax=Serendipita vermifera MAFF 305830 TaxID=933852 RepID=A0A0C2XXT4_SERVB|nr:hypothetical protein M408DRAFT_158581 [Serendipita vermifera MAFF 305830]